MPTYEYRCTACQHLFEEFQSIMDKPLKKCPQCGGRIKRLIGTGAGIIFKGSGFYETDYKRKPVSSKAPDRPAEKPTEKPGAGAASTGTSTSAPSTASSSSSSNSSTLPSTPSTPSTPSSSSNADAGKKCSSSAAKRKR